MQTAPLCKACCLTTIYSASNPQLFLPPTTHTFTYNLLPDFHTSVTRPTPKQKKLKKQQLQALHMPSVKLRLKPLAPPVKNESISPGPVPRTVRIYLNPPAAPVKIETNSSATSPKTVRLRLNPPAAPVKIESDSPVVAPRIFRLRLNPPAPRSELYDYTSTYQHHRVETPRKQ